MEHNLISQEQRESSQEVRITGLYERVACPGDTRNQSVISYEDLKTGKPLNLFWHNIVKVVLIME